MKPGGRTVKARSWQSLRTAGSLTALAATGQTLPYLKPILDIAEPILQEVPEVSGDRRTIGKVKSDIEMSHDAG